MNIAVYCSARTNIAPECFNDARELGKWIGSNGHTLVYGGLEMGLMDAVASATRQAGGKVVGVVPWHRKERQHPANTTNLYVTTLHERKQMMEENADVFVALEGGIGTLDEVFSALASSTFFKQPKEIHLLDRDGLYAPLRQLIENMEQKGLATSPATEMLHFYPDVESMTAALGQLSKNI